VIAGFFKEVANFFLGIFIQIMMLFLKLVRLILDLIFDVANIEFIESTDIESILERVYIIIGILMLFKIVISCIQYLVNPDKLEDKEAGFGAIIKRALIAMALLAFVPTIFKIAKQAQTAIVEALPKIILGAENVSSVENISDKLTFTTALTFFGYNTEYNVSETDDVCNDGSIAGLGNAQGSPMFSTINDIYNNPDVIVESTCNPHKGKRYEVNYLIGFASSIYLTILLASMLLDIGIRVIKFSFLEMIAPIPIASYIDPKTSKKSFDSWVHNCLMVYADLFIRIGVIFLVLHLFIMLIPRFVSNFTLVDGTPLSWGRSRIINIVLIMGMFMFAKNAPKFICDVLGIKSDGSIGDMFKMPWTRAHAPLSAMANPFRNAFNNAAYAVKSKRGVGQVLRRAAGGFLAGSRDSLIAAAQGKNAAEIAQMRKASEAKSHRRTDRSFQRQNHIGEHNALGDRLMSMINGINYKQNDEAATQAYETELESKKSLLQNKMDELKTTTDPNITKTLTGEISALQSEIKSMETHKGKWVARRMIEMKYDDDINAKQETISQIQKKLESPDYYATAEEKMEDINKLTNLQSEVAEMTNKRAENIESMAKEYGDSYDSYNDKSWNAGYRWRDAITAKFNEEVGVSGLSGAAYTQVADTLKSNRGSLWSGEAMTKLTQNTKILVQSGGTSQFPTKLNFRKPDGSSVYDYAELRALYLKVQNGTISDTELREQGCETGADLENIYKDIEKSAATAYINLAMNGKLIGGNPTITESIKRMKVDIENAAITKSEKARMLKKLEENPGKFLADASSLQESLRTKGQGISSYNSGKKEGQ